MSGPAVQTRGSLYRRLALLLFVAASIASAIVLARHPFWRRSAGSSGTTFGAENAVAENASAQKKTVADQRIRFWQMQVEKDPEYWGSLNGLASAYAQKARETGDISYFQLAEGALQASLKAESTHAEASPAYIQLATVHLAEHRFDEAAHDAAKAISLRPDELMPLPFAGDAQLELGNYDAAQHFYDGLAKPNDDRPHQGLEFLAVSHGAGLDWVKGDTTLACEHLRRAVELAEDLHLPAENIAWTKFMLGQQFFLLGDLESAEREETQSLESFPNYHRALAAMGQLRAAQGNYSEAIAYYRRAVAIIPLPLYAAALGDVYVASGDRANAEKQYALVEFIGKLSAINQQVYNRELATFYADHDRNLAEALSLAKKEFEVRHDVFTSDALAWVLLKNHQPERARLEMERALRMGTKDALMEFHAGMIYSALGDTALASSHLKRALELNPHFHVLFAPQAATTLAALKPPAPQPVTIAGTGRSNAPVR